MLRSEYERLYDYYSKCFDEATSNIVKNHYVVKLINLNDKYTEELNENHDQA